MRQRVMHVITTLTTGGAEVMLLRLLSRMNRERFEACVVVLGEVGPIGERIRELGIEVRSLGMRPSLPDPRRLYELSRWMHSWRPAVVQTWMYHADLIGGLAARLAGVDAIVWGIHNTTLDVDASRRSTRWIARALARMSRSIPRRIVCCAEEARRIHCRLGYDAARMVTIPNGFDPTLFRPDPSAHREIRAELGLEDGALLLGQVARFHPQKDHANFVAAAALVCRRIPEVHFLLCGDGVTAENEALADLIRTTGCAERFHLLGRREDTVRILASLDVLASPSSSGEAFPLVVGEAMACGVPCVVTDVGDSALLVGDTGLVVPARQPEALAAACERLLRLPSEERVQLGSRARERIQARYSLDDVVARYESLYDQLITR